MKRFVACLALACLVASVPAGAETVYKWTDKNGKVVYGKQPPAKVKAEQIEVQNERLGGTLGPAAGSGQAANAGSAAEPPMTPFAGSWRTKEDADAKANREPPPKCQPFMRNPMCHDPKAAPSAGPPPDRRPPNAR